MDGPTRSGAIPFPAGALGRWSLRLVGGTDAGTLSCGFLGKARGREAGGGRRPSLSLVLCLAGAGSYDDRWPIAPGDLFIRFPGVPHRVEITAAPWRECWISLGPGAEGLLALDRSRPVRPSPVGAAWVRAVADAVGPLERAADGELPHHLAHLLALAVEALRPPPADGIDLDRARRLLAEPGPSLAEVARDCGLPYDRFRREFRARTGLAPGAYRAQRLMERARRELLAGGGSIANVAEGLGYANPFAFTNAFRRATGMSPRAWRSGGR